MGREKDEDYQKLRQIAEDEQEKAKIIDQVAFIFEKELLSVKSGAKNRAELFSGDFVLNKHPFEIILKERGSVKQTVGYAYLRDRFDFIIDGEVVEKSEPVKIQKKPEPRTRRLRNLTNDSSNNTFMVLQTGLKLKSEPGTLLMLTIDKYVFRINQASPIAETWTLEMFRFKVDDNDIYGGSTKVMPHSMVRAQPLPALPLGK